MTSRYLAALGLSLAMAGCVAEGQTTQAHRQGGSTAVITQEGGGSTMVRRTVTGPDGQTIVQQQGGSTAVIRQQSGADADAPDAVGSIDPQVSDSFRSRFLDRMSRP